MVWATDIPAQRAVRQTETPPAGLSDEVEVDDPLVAWERRSPST